MDNIRLQYNAQNLNGGKRIRLRGSWTVQLCLFLEAKTKDQLKIFASITLLKRYCAWLYWSFYVSNIHNWYPWTSEFHRRSVYLDRTRSELQRIQRANVQHPWYRPKYRPKDLHCTAGTDAGTKSIILHGQRIQSAVTCSWNWREILCPHLFTIEDIFWTSITVTTIWNLTASNSSIGLQLKREMSFVVLS